MSKDSRYTQRVTILVTPEQQQMLFERARARGVSVGEFLRHILFEQGSIGAVDERMEQRIADLERIVRLLMDRINAADPQQKD